MSSQLIVFLFARGHKLGITLGQRSLTLEKWAGRVYWELQMALNMVTRSSWKKGGCPATISKMSTPTAHLQSKAGHAYSEGPFVAPAPWGLTTA